MHLHFDGTSQAVEVAVDALARDVNLAEQGEDPFLEIGVDDELAEVAVSVGIASEDICKLLAFVARKEEAPGLTVQSCIDLFGLSYGLVTSPG